MVDIVISPQDNPSIVLRSNSSRSSLGWDRFARLLGTELQGNVQSLVPNLEIMPMGRKEGNYPLVFCWAGIAVSFNRDHCTFELAGFKEEISSEKHHQVYIWQLAVMLGIASGILRGSRLLPVHGALLASARGALLLCGESGVGKSTTVRRWQDIGGIAPADDLLLLEYGGNGVFAYPLPTWSRGALSLDGACFPVRQKYRLTGILGLGRGELKEEVLSLSEAEFFAQIYRSAFFHLLGIARQLPEEERNRLIGSIRNGVEALTSCFQPVALFAHLDGDLKQTLKDYL